MTSAPPRLMLLDAASLYFRAFFGVPDVVRAPDGTPTNAVRGMLDFVGFLVGTYRPARLVACLDADWRPDFRVQLLPSYKAHRVDMYEPPTGAPRAAEAVSHSTTDSTDSPPDLAVQVPIILDALGALGICLLGASGFEADDVIGTLATRDDSPAGAEHVDIVTGDRDLFQLVDDDRDVRVFYTARGVGKIEIVTDAVLVEKYGIHANQYADFATMRGDPSDGLPGVPGVGDKTAATLLRAYGDLDGIRAAAADLRTTLSMAHRRKIVAAADYLDVAPGVVRVRRDVPVPTDFADQLPAEPRDPTALHELDARYDLGSPLRRAETALFGAPVTPARS